MPPSWSRGTARPPIAFTDGRQIGATLDRNGLRPARWFVTRTTASSWPRKWGVLPVPAERHHPQVAPAAGQEAAGRPRRGPHHLRRGDQGPARRLQPLQGVAGALAAHPRGSAAGRAARLAHDVPLLDKQQAFGYTQEDVKIMLEPWRRRPGGRRLDGHRTPISALSSKSKLLYTYFKQNFALVTNPPIDPIREELVMSLVSFIGPRPNLFDLDGTRAASAWRFDSRSSPTRDLEKIRCIGHREDSFDTKTLDITTPPPRARGLQEALQLLCDRAKLRPRPLQHHHPVRPHGRPGPHTDPGAARHRRPFTTI